jgi:hypothetical protein
MRMAESCSASRWASFAVRQHFELKSWAGDHQAREEIRQMDNIRTRRCD